MTLRRRLYSLVLAAGATAGLLQAYGAPLRLNRGPEGRWWESLRRLTSRTLGAVDERAGPRPVVYQEFAGTLEGSLVETEQLLWDAGFVRNPLARLKTRDGEPEDGSWVYRKRPLAKRQLHLMLFEREDGRTDVYAHDELSSVHPRYGAAHFRGAGQSVGAGVRRARKRLPLDAADAPADPPDVPWASARRDGEDEQE